jgi:hypothetical protein
MSLWRRYQNWQLESRTRYVTTSLGIRVLIGALVAWFFYDTHPGGAPLWFAIFIALGILVWGWFYYPRAKRKSQRTSAPAPRVQN